MNLFKHLIRDLRARSSTHNFRRRIRHRFPYYSAFAWGIPFIIVSIGQLLTYIPGIPKNVVKPNFGTFNCWFPSIADLTHFTFCRIINLKNISCRRWLRHTGLPVRTDWYVTRSQRDLLHTHGNSTRFRSDWNSAAQSAQQEEEEVGECFTCLMISLNLLLLNLAPSSPFPSSCSWAWLGWLRSLPGRLVHRRTIQQQQTYSTSWLGSSSSSSSCARRKSLKNFWRKCTWSPVSFREPHPHGRYRLRGRQNWPAMNYPKIALFTAPPLTKLLTESCSVLKVWAAKLNWIHFHSKIVFAGMWKQFTRNADIFHLHTWNASIWRKIAKF